MGIILDLIIIAIIVTSIISGYKRGLVNVVIKLFALIIAIIVTLIFYKPVSDIIIKNTDWDENIERVIIENASKNTEENNEEGNNSIWENVQKYVDDTVTDTQNQMIENTAKIISVKVINIIAIVGVFIVARLILLVLGFASDVITELPIIKQFNHAGGLIYGLIEGFVLIYAVLAVAFFIVSMSSNIGLSTLVDSSVITKYMYTNNILLNIIF